jgi:hypothetical protein
LQDSSAFSKSRSVRSDKRKSRAGRRSAPAAQPAAEPDSEKARELAVLEAGQRFSRSRLWQWQAEYFDECGATAWASAVPFYATSSVHIARCYAQIIFRYLRDLSALPEAADERPVYIFELGAGSGQFSYYCLEHLAELCRLLPPRLKPCWVMTDFTQSNIDFWKEQPLFAPHLASGLLDMAVFNVDAPSPLVLQHSGRRVAPDEPGGASVAIANYVFDSTRHDIFSIADGRLHETLVSVRTPCDNAVDGRPVRLEAIKCAFENQPLESPGYYADAGWNAVLAGYLAEPGLEGAFVFPTAMFTAMDYLKRLGDGRLLLLASDKGYTESAAIAGRAPPSLAMHTGCFSLSVNFDAVRRFTEVRGGRAFHQPPDNALRSCAYLFDDAGPDRYAETGLAIADQFQSPGPGDFFRVYRYFRDMKEFDLAAFVGFMHACHWDPHLITLKSEPLFASLSGADPLLRRAVHDGLPRAERMIYDKPGMKDHHFTLASLYFALDDHENAERLYAASAERCGETFATCYNIALCRHLLGRNDQAIAAFELAARLEVDGDKAAGWLAKLRAG